MEIKLVDAKIEDFKTINISFKENQISALVGSNNSGIDRLINLLLCNKKILDGTLEIDNNVINEQLLKLKEQTFYINDKKQILFNINILEDFKYYIKNIQLEKLHELLDIFGLEQDICNKNYLELNSSEIKKILLIIGFMSGEKVLIIENPTSKLDYKSIQTLIKQLKKIKRENRIIILTSYNTDFLIQVSDNIIVVDKNEIIAKGDKYEMFSNDKILNKINLKIPKIMKFINIANTKNIKISNNDNINDLIKDVYRNAK